MQECFRIIQSEVLEATIKSLAYNEQARIVTDHHTVRLPLRVNWGGGWSDTPPYCKSDVLKFLLEDNCSLVVRPSGTEPKLKIYISVSAENKEMAEEVEDEIAKTAEKWIC